MEPPQVTVFTRFGVSRVIRFVANHPTVSRKKRLNLLSENIEIEQQEFEDFVADSVREMDIDSLKG